MRYLQTFAIILFVFSLVFTGWAHIRYTSGLNADHPVLSSSVELLELSVQDPPEAILRGLTAEDATDGDLTDRIMVASVSHFLTPGTVNVKYVVFDNHNNSATLTRKVHYTDYKSPVFRLEKPAVYTIGDSFDLLSHVRAEDDLDGDISDQIRVLSNMVNIFSAGTYPVVLEVSNSCGDTAQVTLWVTYLANEPNVFIQLHQYIVYVEQGASFDPRRWLASVTDSEAVALDPYKVTIQGSLDTMTPGFYRLAYSYADGNLTGQTPITVVETERQG